MEDNMIFDSGQKHDMVMLRNNWKYIGRCYDLATDNLWWFWTNSKHHYYKMRHDGYVDGWNMVFVERYR